MTISPDVNNINNSDKAIDLIMERLQNLYDLRVFEDGDPYRVLIRTILSQRTRDDNTDRASAQTLFLNKNH
jgi:endonuclease-3